MNYISNIILYEVESSSDPRVDDDYFKVCKLDLLIDITNNKSKSIVGHLIAPARIHTSVRITVTLL